jgi:hypothetical protein
MAVMMQGIDRDRALKMRPGECWTSLTGEIPKLGKYSVGFDAI